MEVKAKTKKELTQEKSKLAKDIKAKKAELDVLSAKIGDLEGLTLKKDKLEKEVDELTHMKRELGKLTVQHQNLTTEIKDLSSEKKKLNTFVKNNRPKKDTLESELNELDARKAELESKVEALLQNGKKAQANVHDLKAEKEKYEETIAQLKNEYGLFPRELKEMSKDSISQLKNYSLLAILTSLGALALMALLVFVLVSPVVENGLRNSFSNPNYTFYSILISKILVCSALIFFIIMVLNITRGFASQYIKARNRLTSLRVADYLADRIKSSNLTSNGQNGEIKDEMSLLNSYIPKIMDLGGSAFEGSKASKK